MSAKKQAKPAPATPIATAAGLFALAALTILTATLSVLGVNIGNAEPPDLMTFLPFGCYLGGFMLILLLLKLFKWDGDAGLLGCVMLLSGLGLAVQYRMGVFSGATRSLPTLLTVPLGLFAFLAGILLTARRRGGWLAKTGWVAYLGAVALLAAMLVLGRRYRGGVYMPGNMNPSEIAKPLLVFFLAAFLSHRQEEFAKTQIGIPTPALHALILLGVCWCVPLLLAILMHDLGLMLLLNAVLIIMLFAVGKRTGYLALGLAAVTAAAFAVQRLSSHARARFEVWIDPFTDPTGKGWQVLQALSAMYSGGWWGAGLGSGAPQTIPIVTSDFVYAALAEELGLVGCILTLLTYLIFFSRCFRVAGAAPTPYERLLAVGLTGSIAIQTLLNVAGVTKALPMTGITLPFISQGGSSFVTTLLIAGLLVGLSDAKSAPTHNNNERGTP
ncbi:MAG: FtsW/RodA/SpoVE family cell cycle protein [Kiritimatiellae bacterium]|nr:FtsW/RodA/SpoVE family cell cycle protein [Kiritimatiellia bacterium]